MNLECKDCKTKVYSDELKWTSWIRLMNFLEFANLQGDITDELLQQLTNDLLWFKPELKD